MEDSVSSSLSDRGQVENLATSLQLAKNEADGLSTPSFSSLLIQIIFNSKNKHFESSQKLLKSSFVNEKFKKYLKVSKELLTFKITNFAKTVQFCVQLYHKLVCVQLYCKLVLCTAVL